MTKSDEHWEEQRRETRRPITGLARMAQRTHILLGDNEENAYPCKILDASNSGFRIAIKPMPKLEIGSEVVLEHTDKTRQRLSVCWLSAYEAGLKAVE